MGASQGHEAWLEQDKRRFRSSLKPQQSFPIIDNPFLHQSLKRELQKRSREKLQWMWEIILQAPFPDLVKPGLRRDCCAGEDVDSMLVDQGGLQSGDHSKETKLSKMKKSRTRQTTGKEVYNTSWSIMVETQ